MRPGIEHIAILAAAPAGAIATRKTNVFGPGVSALYLSPANGGAPILAALHLDADRFAPDEAKDWVKRHGFASTSFLASATGNAKPFDPSSEIKAALTTGLRMLGAGVPVEFRAAEDRNGKSLRPFTMTAYTGGMMKLDGFYHPVVVDLAGMRVASKAIPMLRDHDPTQIIAHAESVEVSAQRIRAEGVMSGVGEAAKEVNALADNGFPWQASIGAGAQKVEFVESGASGKANGRNFDGPVYIARATLLREISFVPLGADPATSAKIN